MAEGNPFGEEEKETGGPDEEAAILDPLAPEFDWRVKFRTDAVSQIEKWADQFGVSKFALDAFVRDNIDGATDYMARFINVDEMGQPVTDVRRVTPMDVDEFQRAWEAGMAFFSARSGLDFANMGSTRGPGSGSRKPTAGEIRAMFDEDQLTESVNKMWGAYLVEDAPNARQIAKGFIDTVVATGGEQEIDFETFVLGKIRDTNRHKLVYRNKPEGQDELAYISPYTQAAQTVIGGGGRAGAAANDVAAGGAALGASADAFRDRLARTPEHQQTKGFISGLEDRVRGVKNVLRG